MHITKEIKERTASMVSMSAQQTYIHVRADFVHFQLMTITDFGRMAGSAPAPRS